MAMETTSGYRRQFGSDNYAGLCPEALQALVEANTGHVPAYGNDDYTRQACDAIRGLFETECEVFFVFNGTAANALCLASVCYSYHAVIAHEFSHVLQDECAAPEFFTGGARILAASGENGKLDPVRVREVARGRSDLHFSKARAITLAQATEVGTVYTPEEVGALSEVARGLGLKLHMDGARLSNAVAFLGAGPADVTWRAGVDVLSFGMTKNGLAAGEAVVFFDRELARDFEYRAKQAGPLASKMRFLTAPWVAMLRNDVWLHHARSANGCARLLERALRLLPDFQVLFPAEANAVFVSMPEALALSLRERGWRFHDYPDAGGYRFMCAWDTTEPDVAALVADLRDCREACVNSASPAP